VEPFLAGGLMYIVGAVIYGLQYPEKACSHCYDYFGSSHQIFHVLIISAALTHYYGSIQTFHDRENLTVLA